MRIMDLWKVKKVVYKADIQAVQVRRPDWTKSKVVYKADIQASPTRWSWGDEIQTGWKKTFVLCCRIKH
jgi:hypothetical protein